MNYTFSAPVTDAQRQRDTLLGALVGLARSTVNEPKTEDTDRILAAGLRLAADPEAAESALLRMTDIVEAEKHRVAPNCAACAMPCGNTSNYDLARLWGAPAEICALKVRLLSAVCVLAGQKTTAQIQKEICDDLFVLAEDWDTELLGALVGLARSTVNEPKTEDTDRILAAGLRLAADPEAAESALLRMTDIVEAEKHRVAPNCAACAMPCGNTSNYDLARLWGAPAEICALKVRLLSAVCVLAGQKTTAQIQKEICDDLFVLAEDWDTELLLPIVTRAEGLCVQ